MKSFTKLAQDKKFLLIALGGFLIAGVVVGYYIGYDHGWEDAIRELLK